MSTLNDTIAALYTHQSRRVFSTLVRLLGSFDAAEEALHDAFLAATEQWPVQVLPDNPVSWLVSAGRFKAIDRIRRNKRFVCWSDAADVDNTIDEHAADWGERVDQSQAIEDDRLRLIFTCCHPGLAEQTRVALTLREVCGLTTEAVAAAFLVTTPTMAQRIVRARNKIASARIRYRRQLQRFTPKRVRRTRQTGRRLLASTMRCCAPSPAR